MNFKVLSRREIENYQINKKHIVFSVCDPEEKYVNLPESLSRVSSVFMKFPDFDHQIEGYPHNNLIFNEDTAQGVITFFNLYKTAITLVICQCEVGISRSAAIAGALAKSIGQDDSYFFKHYLPNMLVYRLILEEAFKRKRTK